MKNATHLRKEKTIVGLIDKITTKSAFYPTKLLIRAFLEIIIVKKIIFENATRQSLRRTRYEHQQGVKLS